MSRRRVGARASASRGALYRGTALAVPLGSARRGRRLRLGRIFLLVGLTAIGVGGAVACKDPGALRRVWRRIPFARARVTVSGNEYMSAAEVRRAAGLGERVSLVRVDVERARARLLRHRRVRDARVGRRLNGEVHVEIIERRPVVLVNFGRPVEADPDGVLLPALVSGAVPDLPVVTGLAVPLGRRVRDRAFTRALGWVRALGAPEVGLAGRVSEVDVSAAAETRVVLGPDGVRLLLPGSAADAPWLGAIRVVLADLSARGRRAGSIDCRAPGLAVVRPLDPGARARGPGGPSALGRPGQGEPRPAGQQADGGETTRSVL